MSLGVTKFDIEGLLLIASKVFSDDRGYFFETFKQSEFQELNLPEFVQDNFSFSKKNVLRGLHYQLAPKAQGKLVRCLAGKIWDVAVDLRKASATYGKWCAVELSEGDGLAFYLPEAFAHGFVVLSETARVLYKTTAEYSPELERGIVWNDSNLGIKWPVENPVLAKRDTEFPTFNNLII